jgi:hypothetical protein
MHLTDPASYRQAAGEVHRLIDEGLSSEAITFADRCQGEPVLTEQIRALAYTDAGCHLGSKETLLRAIELWQQIEINHPQLDYHLANAEIAVWDLAVTTDGRAAALETSRKHLHRARQLYAKVGDAPEVSDELRVQALTNLGNSLDSLGRDVDAMDRYDQALAIDPTFGMALGNKGTTLLGIIPLTEDHVPALVADAARLLDGALADRDRVLQIGGVSALKNFESRRERISLGERRPASTQPPWSDPYLSWCMERGLFLHVSPACLSSNSELLDPLFFRGVTVGMSRLEQRRVNFLIDAFDAIKQDYLAARYTTWLATSRRSPIVEQSLELAPRARFLDSLSYARWGPRTGMALQAFTATINALDKIASFVHLYLDIDRKDKVYFRTLWHPRGKRNKPDVMHTEIAEGLRDPECSRGLLALCDLSCDLEQDTSLNKLVERRHAATHRFLVAHHMLVDSDQDSNDWLEGISWDELIDGTLAQMRTARAALVYLARTVDTREAARHETLKQGDGVVPTMPLWPMDPGLSEID